MSITSKIEFDRAHLTVDQAIALVGSRAVEAVTGENCEPTNRVGYNGKCQGDDLTEWSASVPVVVDGVAARLYAMYYTTNEQDQLMSDADGDGSAIDWQIDHYRVS